METELDNHKIAAEVINFLIDRKSRRLSPNSIAFYKEKLDSFNDYCAGRGVEYMEDISPRLLREYLILLGDNHNPGGVNTFYRSVRTFLNYFEEETDEQLPNPIRKVHAPRVPTQPIVGVPLADISAMLITCKRDLLGLRDAAILRALVDTGLRRSEFCNLRIMDLNMETGALNVIGGKGGKNRIVYMNATTRRDIMKYLRKRRPQNARDYLWVTEGGRQLSHAGLRQILRRRAEMANIEEPSPHDFRRTFAIQCLRSGMSVVQLMNLMGHTTTTVLQRYLAMQPQDLQDAHEKYGPLENIDL